MEVAFTPAAIADLIGIRSYIGQFNPRTASRISDQLVAAALSLSEFPRRGQLNSDGSRELISIYPYVIMYDIEDTGVAILRIMHGARERPSR